MHTESASGSAVPSTEFEKILVVSVERFFFLLSFGIFCWCCRRHQRPTIKTGTGAEQWEQHQQQKKCNKRKYERMFVTMNFYSFVCQWLKFIIEFAIAPNVWRHNIIVHVHLQQLRDNFFLVFFSATKWRFHLNVLLFCKYKLWPLLNHVLHRRWHNDKEKNIQILVRHCACGAVRPKEPKIDLKWSFMERARDRRVIFTPLILPFTISHERWSPFRIQFFKN